jgi:hypothetical protein
LALKLIRRHNGGYQIALGYQVFGQGRPVRVRAVIASLEAGKVAAQPAQEPGIRRGFLAQIIIGADHSNDHLILFDHLAHQFRPGQACQPFIR